MVNIKQIFNEKDLEMFDMEEKKALSGVIIENIIISRKQKKVDIYLMSKNNITETILEKIEKITLKHLKVNKIKINWEKLDDLKKVKSLVSKGWSQFLGQLSQRFPAATSLLQNSDWKLDGDCIYVYLEQSGIKLLKEQSIHSFTEKYFECLGFPLKVVLREKLEKKLLDIYEEEREIVESILKESENRDNLKNGFNNSSPNIIGNIISRDPEPIGTNIVEKKDVVFAGEVFNVEKRYLKNKTIMISFGLTDYTGSISVKVFLSGEQKSLETMIEEGLWLKIRGKIEKNKYSEEYELGPFDINILKKPERQDDYPEKRVELHLHTRFSSMDALCSPTEVLKMAKKWGHKAVAFTDHGVLQSFPEVYAASKKIDIKPIYGLEAYLFDDELPVMISPPNKPIEDVTFVVTDIETSGLCFDSDEIIEIGAVKILNNEVVDRFSCLIKPKKPIPANITNLTGITNEMLQTAQPIELVLPSFMQFLGDSIFVAHNADFDSGFIRREANRLGLPFTNKILDTLSLARIVFCDLKNHRLDTLAKKLNIRMGSHHRAVDDANTAAFILLELLREVKEVGIDDLSRINEIYKLQKNTAKLIPYHATILVKNNVGLKNLYKLVSISHLDFFYRHPRIPKSLYRTYSEGLIIGTGCQAGELFQSLLHISDSEKIKNAIEFYDFLEIQPIHNNKFLIDNGYVSNQEILKTINKKIYNLGKEYNKPVVMTGDVHFLNPMDEIYRKILLSAQGFQDADKESKLFFKTTKEMLDECNYLGPEIAKEVVIVNPNKIANEVEEGLKPFPEELYTPNIEGAEQEIISMTYQRAKELYGKELPAPVENRIKRELDSIVNNGYAVIYLIAHKLVKKSLDDGYLVGSRGSVGSSFVATLCGITEVNPLPAHYLCPKCQTSIFKKDSKEIVGPDLPDQICPKCGMLMEKDGFNIPFEVFMGFEGDKVPDIDLNFSGEYQANAHKFTEELFGKQYVFRAGTISTIAQKTAFGFVKSYLEERNIFLPSIEINRLSNGITGIKRTTGQHPGGLIIVPKDKEIFDFTPIQHPADDKNSGITTTHFEYHSICDSLLKLDLLGHDDPTTIKMLEGLTGFNSMNIPLDDKDTLEIFSSLKSLSLNPEELGTTVGTIGVPEFGTKFVRQMLEDTRPSSFSELVRISGLSHGTDVWLNNARDIIKKNIATLKDVIATRDDIMIYLISKGIKSKIAFNIMEDVRKGRGLKPEYEKLLLENNNIDSWFINSCKKIKYLFPKAHAVAYVVMAFRIAFFKVHYPEAFYATYFTIKANDFDAALILQGPKKIREAMTEIEQKEKAATAKDKSLYTILEVANEMHLRNINFVPIDLYKSDTRKFIITKDGIMPPITALQGLGITAAENIKNERKRGKFTSIEDLQQRTKITKNVVQILKQNGVLNNLQETDQLSLF